MTISRRTPATTAATSTTAALTLNKPASIAAGDRAFIYAGGKYGGTWTQPAVATTGGDSWTLVGQYLGYDSGDTGNDVGRTVGWLFAKDLTATDVSNDWTCDPDANGTAPNSYEVIAVAYATTEMWKDTIAATPVAHWTDDTGGNAGLGLEATVASFASYITAGDMFVVFGTIPTDAATSIQSAKLTWPGTGFSGSNATATSYVEASLGNDSCSVAGYWDTVTGTATAYDPSTLTLTINQSGNTYGVLVGILVREEAGQNPAVTQTTETDTAQALTQDKQVTVVQATETSTAQPITVDRGRSVVQAEETSTAQIVDRGFTVTLAEDTEVAQPFSSSRDYTITLVTETNEAQIITVSQPIISVTVYQAVEADLSQPLTQDKYQSVPLVEETDEAWATEPGVPVVISTEADTATALSSDKNYSIGFATEADDALTIGSQAEIRVTILVATETDTATQVLKGTTPALETDTAAVVSSSKDAAVVQVASSDTSLPIVTSKTVDVVQAVEVDAAQPSLLSRGFTIVEATQTDIAQRLHRAIGLAPLNETDVAQPITFSQSAINVTVYIASETDTDTVLVADKNHVLTELTETDVATAVGQDQFKTILQVVESDGALSTYTEGGGVSTVIENDIATEFIKVKEYALGKAWMWGKS